MSKLLSILHTGYIKTRYKDRHCRHLPWTKWNVSPLNLNLQREASNLHKMASIWIKNKIAHYLLILLPPSRYLDDNFNKVAASLSDHDPITDSSMR